jgi:hypothetical protein
LAINACQTTEIQRCKKKATKLSNELKKFKSQRTTDATTTSNATDTPASDTTEKDAATLLQENQVSRVNQVDHYFGHHTQKRAT